MLRRLTLLALALSVLAASPASAQRPVPLTAADGVTASYSKPRVTLTIPAEAAQRAALGGREVTLTCEHRPPPGLLLISGDQPGTDSSATFTVPRDGRQIAADLADGPWDLCRATEAEGHWPLVEVALTDRGRAWQEDAAAARGLLDALYALRSSSSYPPTSDAVAAADGTLVALDGPDAAPPPGAVGFWSDGAQHATLAATSANGRRLVYEDVGDRMYRTNVTEFMPSWEAFTGRSLFVFPGPFDGVSPRKRELSPDLPAVLGKGIHARRDGRSVTIRFAGRSAAAFRRIAGRLVTVTCITRSAVRTLGGDVPLPELAGTAVRAPRHGEVLRAEVRRGSDLCSVIRDDGRFIAAAALRPAAATWWTEIVGTARLVLAMPDQDGPPHGTTYPSAKRLAEVGGRGVIALPEPDGPVPPGRVGVWSDGAHRALLTTSAGGRRLVYADEGNGVSRSNVDEDAVAAFLLLGDATG